MRWLAAVLLALAASTSAHLQDVAALARQLTFETDHPGGWPAGWNQQPAQSARADEAVVRSGRWAARIERAAGAAGEFTTLSRVIPLDVAGKTVVLRGFLRTEAVTGFAALWLREDGVTPSVAFGSTQNRQVKGTSDWHEHSVSVPVRPEGTRLTFGVIVSGSGTVWVDDLELLVDGVPFADAPKAVREPTILDKDQEFDAGSRIAVAALTPAQIDNLTTLGKVWGFLKYHHPLVRAGTRHWDYDLFRIMPAVLAAADRRAGNGVLHKWVSDLGPIAECNPCAPASQDVHLPADLDWINDQSALGAELSAALRRVHSNRPAAGTHFFVALAPGVQNPVFQNEPAYASITASDAGYQLLALYRFWNIIQYWFPYRDVIGERWDGVLREFIPKLAQATTKLDYERQLLALIARVHDTHANLWSSLASRPPAGACQLSATLRFVEGHAVVVAAGGGLERGDVVVDLGGAPVTKLITDWTPFYAASNQPTRLRDIARTMTRGECGETTVGIERNGARQTVTATRVAPQGPAGGLTHDLAGPTFRKLSDDVAYLKLSSVKLDEVAGYLDGAAGTKGLVIDIRNYPSAFVVFALGQALAGDQAAFARFTQGDLVNPGVFRWGPVASLTPAARRYQGRVVIVVDEVSQSQAEYTAMAFRTAPGAVVVGSTTAGADGNVSEIPLPGGKRSMISGIGVFYPDQRPTQRIGIIPDVVVTPTIAGIRAGRDEVLETAIRQIVGSAVALAEIQKMIANR
jgi:hypothetical protein